MIFTVEPHGVLYFFPTQLFIFPETDVFLVFVFVVLLAYYSELITNSSQTLRHLSKMPFSYVQMDLVFL